MSRRIRIGITAGDINGIGPEVALKAFAARRGLRDVEFVFYGPEDRILEQAAKFRLPCPGIVDAAPDPRLAWRPGHIEARAGRAAAKAVRAAALDCLEDRLDAMVTAPLSKEALHKGGEVVPGHTELLAELCGTKRFAMMLFGGPLRVVLATRHIPLAEVARRLTGPVLREQVELTAEALPWLGARRGRIAVCGLNPHAGEGGDIGREEIDTIAPALRALRRRGIDACGPLPADTVFHAAARGDYDAVVAMYHDQGLAPLKLIAFDTGVNVTLGLPIARTSPDHGTAFDIAGRGIARASSMLEAVDWAIRLARTRNPWR